MLISLTYGFYFRNARFSTHRSDASYPVRRGNCLTAFLSVWAASASGVITGIWLLGGLAMLADASFWGRGFASDRLGALEMAGVLLVFSTPQGLFIASSYVRGSESRTSTEYSCRRLRPTSRADRSEAPLRLPAGHATAPSSVQRRFRYQDRGRARRTRATEKPPPRTTVPEAT